MCLLWNLAHLRNVWHHVQRLRHSKGHSDNIYESMSIMMYDEIGSLVPCLQVHNIGCVSCTKWNLVQLAQHTRSAKPGFLNLFFLWNIHSRSKREITNSPNIYALRWFSGSLTSVLMYQIYLEYPPTVSPRLSSTYPQEPRHQSKRHWFHTWFAWLGTASLGDGPKTQRILKLLLESWCRK